MSLPALLSGQRVDPSVSRRAIEARKYARRVADRNLELYAELRAERAARLEAEKNARHFHALLIAERVKHLPARREP